MVVLVSFLAQPRLQFVMANDGLLPSVFSEMDTNGNLSKGILMSGSALTIVALFVPFRYLDDMISAGVLLSCKSFYNKLDISDRLHLRIYCS